MKEEDSKNLFSVIIPNKDRINLLFRAVDSALQQSYKKIEILVIDDSREEIHNEIKRKYRNTSMVKVIRGNSTGSSGARLLGLKLAKGDYVSFLDSDDTWEKEKLESHKNCIESFPDVGVCFDILTERKPNTDLSKVYRPPLNYTETYTKLERKAVLKELLKENFIHMSCGTINRRNFHELYFSATEPQDYLSWMYYSERSDFGLVPFALTNKYPQLDSRSSNKRILFQENIVIQKTRIITASKSPSLTVYEKVKLVIYSLALMSGFYVITPEWIKNTVIRGHKKRLFAVLLTKES